MGMHWFLCMTVDAECLVIISAIIISLCVYMMSMHVFVVGGVAEIHWAVFASPAIFRSIAMAGLAKAIAIFVERSSIVGVQWQGCDLIFRMSREILLKSEGVVDFLVVPTQPTAISFVP
jgi:hypothetical protein